jgi:hypothetical protein
MTFDDLNASGFNYSTTFYHAEFEGILSGIVAAYDEIVVSNTHLPNDENEIRDVFLDNYLKNDRFKKQHIPLNNFHFDLETRENAGRADIRILPVNPYRGDKEYYIIECKRINAVNTTGVRGLNAEYIKNGICRFVSDYYSSLFGTNGMLGFVVDEIDIDSNVSMINALLSMDFHNDRKELVNANPIQNITKIEIRDGFNFAYNSRHKSASERDILIYHLMFDFSKNIQ